jgi:hypothetical protein
MISKRWPTSGSEVIVLLVLGPSIVPLANYSPASCRPMRLRGAPGGRLAVLLSH